MRFSFKMKIVCNNVLNVIAKLFNLLFLLCGFYPIIPGLAEKPEIVLQIIAPYSTFVNQKLRNTHVQKVMTIRHGYEIQYRHLRAKMNINSYLNFTDTESPREILTLFCNEIFGRNVNTIISLNFGSGMDRTPSPNDYILSLADHMGIPVISWDPNYPGALQSKEDSRMLQIAPTIYHQCQAMIRILERYNWTDFSIVTTKISSHLDFLGCMNEMLKQTSTKQGYITKAKFTLLSSVVIDIDEDDYKVRLDQIRDSLQTLIKTVSRVVLLHARAIDAKDILDMATEMGLTDPLHIWILTAPSVGTVSRRAARSYPVGTLAIMYNDSVSVIQKYLEASIDIWALALNSIARNPSVLDKIQLYPTMACNQSLLPSWKDGSMLYRQMKSKTIVDPPVSFTYNGIIENVNLRILNVKPTKEVDRRGNPVNKWEEVGQVVPRNVTNRIEMEIQMDEIVWPGEQAIPPKGKPDKKFYRIATLEEPPYIIYVPTDPVTGMCDHHSVPCRLQVEYNTGNNTDNGTYMSCCTGLCVDLLKVLSQKLNFDYEFYEVADGKWGIRDDVTGEWNGLIEDLLDNKADMVVTSLKINHQRNTAIDFSVPFLETGITIIVSIRKGAISPTAFLEPFDIRTWLFIAVLSVNLVAMTIMVFEWFSPQGLNRGVNTEPYDYPSWCLILVFCVHATGASIFIFEWLSPSGLNQGKTPLREHKFSLFRSFWLIWAMLFGAAVSTDNPRGLSSRFLSTIWALFALVFLASYTANLAAFMITIDEYYDLTGIQDFRLINPTAVNPHFRFATVPGGSTENNLKENYPRMHKYMQKYNQTDVDAGIEALKKQEIHAFIYDATVLEYRAGEDKDCELRTVGKWYATTGYGVGFPRGSPMISDINKVLLDLQYHGEMERLQKFWLAGACHSKKDKKDHSSHNIGILNFTSAFILLAGGVVLGAILLILEHMYFKFGRTCLKKYDKWGCCALVSLSMGKSLTFEQSVFEAIDYHKRHRCKDPLCETQLWKAKHELDLALIKIERMRDELVSTFRQPIEGAPSTTTVTTEDDRKFTEPNGMTSQNKTNRGDESHYEIPHDILQKDLTRNSSIDSKESSELQKRRAVFRRSPSYTNAMSTETDQTSSDTDREIKRSPMKQRNSYSEAVKDGNSLENFTGPKPNRTRFYDGKFYVGVEDDQDESML